MISQREQKSNLSGDNLGVEWLSTLGISCVHLRSLLSSSAIATNLANHELQYRLGGPTDRCWGPVNQQLREKQAESANGTHPESVGDAIIRELEQNSRKVNHWIWWGCPSMVGTSSPVSEYQREFSLYNLQQVAHFLTDSGTREYIGRFVQTVRELLVDTSSPTRRREKRTIACVFGEDEFNIVNSFYLFFLVASGLIVENSHPPQWLKDLAENLAEILSFTTAQMSDAKNKAIVFVVSHWNDESEALRKIAQNV
eukprot:Selendium_serpulae@DN5873_c0_g1_i1.p1